MSGNWRSIFFNVGLCWYNVLLFLFNHLLILLIYQQKLEEFYFEDLTHFLIILKETKMLECLIYYQEENLTMIK